MGFTKSEAYYNLHYIFVHTNLFILVLYVDDLFLKVVVKFISRCKENMATEFDMKQNDIALLLRVGGLAKTRGDFKWVESICNSNPEEASNGGYKPMATLMIANLKNVIPLYSKFVDPTMCR